MVVATPTQVFSECKILVHVRQYKQTSLHFRFTHVLTRPRNPLPSTCGLIRALPSCPAVYARAPMPDMHGIWECASDRKKAAITDYGFQCRCQGKARGSWKRNELVSRLCGPPASSCIDPYSVSKGSFLFLCRLRASEKDSQRRLVSSPHSSLVPK